MLVADIGSAGRETVVDIDKKSSCKPDVRILPLKIKKSTQDSLANTREKGLCTKTDHRPRASADKPSHDPQALIAFRLSLIADEWLGSVYQVTVLGVRLTALAATSRVNLFEGAPKRLLQTCGTCR